MVGVGAFGSKITDRGAAYLTAIPDLEALNIGGTAITAITAAGVRKLAGAMKLRELDLIGPEITDEIAAGVMHYVSELSGLKELWLNSKIGDEGIAQLTRLPKLELLDLSGSKITDAAADDLMKLDYLFHLNVTYTQLSADCVKTLRAPS